MNEYSVAKQLKVVAVPLLIILAIVTVFNLAIDYYTAGTVWSSVLCELLWIALVYAVFYRNNWVTGNGSKAMKQLILAFIVASAVSTAGVTASSIAYVVFSAIIGVRFATDVLDAHEAKRSKSTVN